jgi:hypothetical protein
MGMVTPLVLGWATWSLTNQQWQSQQWQYRNSIQEQDRSRVMDRLLALGGGSPADRLSAAKALRSYANMNRMDAANLPGLLPYLVSECDGNVFRIEKDAALQAARNSSAQSSLAGIAAIESSPQCPKVSIPELIPAPAVSTTVVTAPPQYFEVGCGEVKTGTLEIPVPSAMASNQRIQDISATIANISNLKTSSARVVSNTDRSAKVEYHLEGRDRELFGNCPGGGHGSVVTTFTIVTK